MRDRWYRKGGSKTDPAVGRAAEANYALAARAQDWNEDFYEKYVVPMITLAGDETRENIRINREISDLTMKQAREADERYRTVGLPSEDKYLAELGKFSEPEYAETQARGALGDVNAAFAGQQAAQRRQMQSLGIDPSSPAALMALTDMGIQQAAVRAGAATRARDAAKQAGLGALAEAANVSGGQGAKLLQFAGAAGGAAGAGTAAAQGGIGATSGGAANVNAGLGLANKAYGQNLESATELKKARMAQPSGLAGIGKLAGTLGGAFLGGSGFGAMMGAKG